jgi:DNA gyrase subunit A
VPLDAPVGFIGGAITAPAAPATDDAVASDESS